MYATGVSDEAVVCDEKTPPPPDPPQTQSHNGKLAGSHPCMSAIGTGSPWAKISSELVRPGHRFALVNHLWVGFGAPDSEPLTIRVVISSMIWRPIRIHTSMIRTPQLGSHQVRIRGLPASKKLATTSGMSILVLWVSCCCCGEGWPLFSARAHSVPDASALLRAVVGSVSACKGNPQRAAWCLFEPRTASNVFVYSLHPPL